MSRWKDTTLLLEYHEEANFSARAGEFLGTWPVRATAVLLGALLGTIVALKMLPDTAQQQLDISSANAKSKKTGESEFAWTEPAEATANRTPEGKQPPKSSTGPEAIAPESIPPTETTPTETTPTETTPTEGVVPEGIAPKRA